MFEAELGLVAADFLCLVQQVKQNPICRLWWHLRNGWCGNYIHISKLANTTTLTLLGLLTLSEFSRHSGALSPHKSAPKFCYVNQSNTRKVSHDMAMNINELSTVLNGRRSDLHKYSPVSAVLLG